MTSELTYYPHPTDPLKLIVYGDYDKFKTIMKKIGARWNSKLKSEHGSKGWTISTQREEQLIKLCESFKTDEEDQPKETLLEKFRQNVKSRKNQTKLHRATSPLQPNHPLNYYKKYAKSPKFKSPELSSVPSSYVSEDEESEPGLPNPDNFVKKDLDEISIMDEKINKLSNKLDSSISLILEKLETLSSR